MARVSYGAKSLVVDLEKFSDEIERWAKKGILKTTNTIANTAKSLVPVDQGNLRKSITTEMRDGGLTGVINVGSDYAIYVEFGTGIYATGPGGSKAKKIPWAYEKDGKWIWTKGQHPQPYWFPAIDAGRKVFESYFS